MIGTAVFVSTLIFMVIGGVRGTLLSRSQRSFAAKNSDWPGPRRVRHPLLNGPGSFSISWACRELFFQGAITVRIAFTLEGNMTAGNVSHPGYARDRV
jgi:hypothetical protein